MKLKNSEILAIFIIVVIAASYMGYINLGALLPNNVTGNYSLNVSSSGSGTLSLSPGSYSYASGTPVSITATSGTISSWTLDGMSQSGPVQFNMNGNHAVTVTLSGGAGLSHPSSPVQMSFCDWILGSTIGTASYADVIPASSGVFDLLSYGENVVAATTWPIKSTNYYADGSQLLIHVYSGTDPANGLDFYDVWYYVVVHDGNSVYFISKANFVQNSGSPHYKYTINTAGAATTGFTVAFTSGTTNYWDLGKVYAVPRTAAAGLNLYLTYSGTTMSSVVNGASWITGSSTANSTLSGNSEHINMLLTMDAANLAWGNTWMKVTTQGEIKSLASFIIFSTNMTAIDAGQLGAEGWTQMSDNTLTAEKCYYKQVGPYYTTKGSLWTQDIPIPVYSGAAASGGRYIFKFWIIDGQDPSNVAIGAVSTTIPTAYGCVTAYGLSADVQATAYSTSSGVGSGQAITCWVITT